MARTLRNPKIDSRTARLKLPPQGEPYWMKITKGCYLGYRRNQQGGNWIARFRDDIGQQKQTGLGAADDSMDADDITALSFEQAQSKARDWFQTIANGGERSARAAYTVADCIEDYLSWVKVHRKSHRHLRTYADAYIIPRLGKMDCKKLTAQKIRAWHQAISEEPPRLRSKKDDVTPKYREEDANPLEAERKRRLRANRHLVTLRAALNRAWREGKITSNNAWTRLQLFSGTEKPRSRFLSREEAKRLINTCLPDLRKLVQLALLTGARYGELCAFDVRDFHPDSGTLHVLRSKSGKARHIFLTSEGVAFCKTLTLGQPPEAPLLRRSDGSRWARDLHFRGFKDAVKRVGLDQDFTFHELRHTWASLTIMAGAPLMAVAENLGHRDTRMVEWHYGHLLQSYKDKMVEQFAPKFGFEDDGKVMKMK